MLAHEIGQMYHRQFSLDVVFPEVVSVVGVGGIGYYIAFNAAMLGTTKIILYDSDALENSNRNRLPYGVEDMGKNKAEACRDILKHIRPNTAIFAYPNVDEWNIETLEGMVYICTDDVLSQNIVREYCVEKELNFLRLGYDGRHFTIENRKESIQLWEADEDDSAEEIEGRYTVVPSYSITPQIVAIAAFLFTDMIADRQAIDVTANVFHIGQGLLDGEISDSVRLKYPDRHSGDPELVDVGGRRLRI